MLKIGLFTTIKSTKSSILMGARAEETEDGVRWRELNRCGDP